MKIPVPISDQIYIPRLPELSDVLADIRSRFSYKNPKYYQMKRIGKWVGNIDESIKNWTHVIHGRYGPCLAIPRGGLKKVREVANIYDLELSILDQRLSLPPVKGLKNEVKLWELQQPIAEIAFKKENCLIRAPTGAGKCLDPNTNVLMYSGDAIKAKDVKIGDQLMGPDSKPRTVLQITNGYGPMYKIIPNKGISWICNKAHILTLINTTTNKFVDIAIEDYIHQSKNFKHLHKLTSTPINFSNVQTLPLDPYFLGVWLGDGRKKLSVVEITKEDPEIVSNIKQLAKKWGLQVVTDKYPNRCITHRIIGKRGLKNPLLETLRKLMKDGIRIPKEYKTTTIENRYEILAGILDTDGYCARGYFELSQARKEIIDDVEFIALSLGFKTTRREKIINDKTYYLINIIGDISKIPTKIQRKQARQRQINKDPKRTGFRIVPIGNGNYVGWVLKEEPHFLLGDFTITHNTEILLKIAEWILQTSGPVLIVVWEGNIESGLFKQWIDRINKCFGIYRDNIGTIVGGRTKKIQPITVAMQQTLVAQARKGNSFAHCFGGVLCDEVQRFGANTFQQIINTFPARYRIGASADERRVDGREFLIYDAFGEIAGEAEKKSLIAQGKIVPVTARIIPSDFNLYIQLNKHERFQYADMDPKDKDFNLLLSSLCDDEDRNDLIWTYLEPCLKAGQTIAIGTHRVAHAKYWDRRIREHGYNCGLLLGGTKQADEFESTVHALRNRNISAGVGTIKKIAQGHDIPALDRGFIITPLGNNPQLLNQFAGRLRRPEQGKKDAILYYIWDKYLYSGHSRKIAKVFKHSTEMLVDDEFIKFG